MKSIPFPTAESQEELDELRRAAYQNNYFNLDKFAEEVWFEGLEPKELDSADIHGF